VDVEHVRLGIGADKRIGYHFIYPGCGYGGSCFPKDVKALIHMAEENNFEPFVLNSVELRNYHQKYLLAEKIFTKFGKDLTGKIIALWGLSFKPGTDDMREAPSLILIQELLEAGATIHAHDPIAIETAQKEIRKTNGFDRIKFFHDQYDVLTDADALAISTEWKPFRNPDFSKLITLLKKPIIFDGRNQYNPIYLKEIGIEYYAIGRGVKG